MCLVFLSRYRFGKQSHVLSQVLAFEGIDHTRTTSNDVIETFAVLGIEAARATLLKEIRDVIQFDGSYINYRHLSTL
jgi:DNA-directed RNA polymerase II subunit RPB1